jgi:hypothetical protein
MRLGACLSLTGPFGRFGRQAARALEAWARLTGVEVVICDDASDVKVFTPQFRALRCDLLLGPYSTQLMRAAAEELEGLMFNHGGAGDDVQALRPGQIVSVLAPTSRYALPFVRIARSPLCVATGPGQFGRQIAAGALAEARRLGVTTTAGFGSDTWDLFSAGRFEDDIAIVEAARAAPSPPRTICSIAAGVQDFAPHDPEGVYGIAQWVPGAAPAPELGPSEAEFLAAYGAVPDYPAVQAVAAAAIAVHCAELAGSTEPHALWEAATSLETTTLLGTFRIDPVTGAQVAHTPVLVRWRDGARASA